MTASREHGRARVLITGGAIGIGAACARRFAAVGYGVVIADILDREGGMRGRNRRLRGGR